MKNITYILFILVFGMVMSSTMTACKNGLGKLKPSEVIPDVVNPINPPMPANLVYKEPIGTNLDYLLGTWEGNYISTTNGHKLVRFHITSIKKVQDGIEVMANYCWGTYPSRPYAPGCKTSAPYVFDGNSDLEWNGKIGMMLTDSGGVKMVYTSYANQTSMHKVGRKN